MHLCVFEKVAANAVNQLLSECLMVQRYHCQLLKGGTPTSMTKLQRPHYWTQRERWCSFVIRFIGWREGRLREMTKFKCCQTYKSNDVVKAGWNYTTPHLNLTSLFSTNFTAFLLMEKNDVQFTHHVRLLLTSLHHSSCDSLCLKKKPNINMS